MMKTWFRSEAIEGFPVMAKRYQAYLLRIWQAGDRQNPDWRVSIEDPQTRKMTGFTRLEDLFQFLRGLTGTESEEDPGADSE
jgi:hypothetical protein